MVSFNFNVDELPEEKSFSPLPDGDYQAMIQAVDGKETSKGGQMITIKWEILGPTHVGRIVFDNLNVRNPPGVTYADPNKDPEQIALGRLGSTLRAIGMRAGKDTDEWIGGNAILTLATEPAKDGWDAKNKIKRVRALEGSAPPAAAGPGWGKTQQGGQPPKRPF